MYQYNYILFNTFDNKHYINYDGYYYICAKDLVDSPNVKVVTFPLEGRSRIIKIIFDIHNSEKIDKYIHLPLKKLWYPYFFSNPFDNNKPLCFIILNHYLPISYLQYLKKRYPTCKIVLLHRDLVKVSHRMNSAMSQNPYLDLEMTYDKGESAKFGFPHFNEFESKIDVPVETSMESDIFFAGNSKGRLPLLLEAYHLFTKEGLKCKYYLTGVSKEDREDYPGIEYADKQMTYKEMLYHTVNTRCVLEINQKQCDGYTSRFLEAVMYGKKLITNNVSICETRFYSPDKIMIFNNVSEIDPSFVRKGADFIDYHYNDDFSPFRMVDRVEEELIKHYGAGRR